MANNNPVKDQMKARLLSLIEKYNRFIQSADTRTISEETIRTWINDMLSIFGWDVQDTHQVLQERKLGKQFLARLEEIDSSHSRPDYILLNGQNIKAFVDAKDLDVNIFVDKSAAFQIRSYAWSARIPCSFVTNFKQFAIFDCRSKPNPEQPANHGTIQLEISEYIDKFDILYDHLFQENIRENKLEELYSQFAVEGRDSLDTHFNALLTDFRLKLANELVRNNDIFNQDDSLLNYYVQVILDRIIFIRVCESKGIEQIGKLKAFKDAGFWSAFKESCYMEFYKHYDGAMFERDNFFQDINLLDDIFTDFISNLYYPSPYKFDAIPVKVIAQIYEDFLSKHLVVKDNKVIEQLKNEYVKEKGAISTPEYIVDALISKTIALDRLSTIDDVLQLKILDPACGSGVFLVSCFEIITNRIILLYNNNLESNRRYDSWFINQSEKIFLTVDARREIIKGCLYGIDIDEAAIEVAKMSLALKVVDNNDLLSLEDLGVFGDKILREIHSNIKLGNTLVNSDISIDANSIKLIKPFDIVSYGFKTVFENNGGFDYIVGNPPYVETKHYKLASPDMHKYIKEKYTSFEGKADLSIIFIERCLALLNATGRLGFIVQKRFFKTTYGKGIRGILSADRLINTVVDFETDKLFRGRITYVAMLILDKRGNDFVQYELIPFEPTKIKAYFENSENLADYHIEKTLIPSEMISEDVWAFESYEMLELLTILKKKFGTLGEYNGLFIKDGIQALWKKAYHLSEYRVGNGYVEGLNGFGERVKIELAVARPIVYNKLFYCFMDFKPHAYSLFPYREDNNKTPISMSELRQKFPCAYAYLIEKETLIKQNVEHVDDPEYWHRFTREHNHDTYLDKKIIIPMTTKDTIATCSLENGLFMDNANVWFIKVQNATDTLLKAIAAVINSTVFSVLAKATANPQSGGYYKLNKQFLFPIPFPSKAIIEENDTVNKLARLYDEISAQQADFSSGSPNMKSLIRGTLTAKWDELDNICYDTYELNESQMALIKAAGRTVNRVDLLSGV